MILGKPAPFVSAFIDAVDNAIRAHQPHHGMSAMQRAWLAFWVTAVVVTNSICWARFARASLGTYALAAFSRMFRHSKMPWDDLLVASVRVILHHHGITSGSLLLDETDNPRSKAAHTLAHLYKLREGIRVRRDTLWRQPVSAMAWFRFRGRGKSSMFDNTVSKRSGNVLMKKRDAGVVPSVA